MSGAIPLQLEVTINGQPTNLIAQFFQLADSRIAASTSQLAAMGIKLPDSAAGQAVVPLSDMPGLRYEYNLARQTIDLVVADEQRQRQVFNARAGPTYSAPQQSFGAFLNYGLFMSGSSADSERGLNAALNLDAHVFGQLGTFSQSAIIGTTPFEDGSMLRLESTWSYSDPEKIATYRAGDIISGGLAWTRPIRMAGVQVQRDFSLRPDLITMPLPSVSGSAALPSTLDVYVGNVKTYSTTIPNGPYRIDNIPVASGTGTARLVLTDSAGRQIETDAPFFTDIRLLREGFFSYSVEAGFARLNYGLHSSTYHDVFVGSGSLRWGLSDTLSIEGHTEFGNDLINGGAGLVFSMGQFGLMSGAASVSSQNSATGGLLYGGWYLPLANFSFQTTTQRTIGDYRDLASISSVYGTSAPPGFNVPRAIDQAAVSFRFPGSRTNINLAVAHLDRDEQNRSIIVSTSISRSFVNGMSIFASAFRDVGDAKSMGIFAGIAIPLGDSLTGFAGVTHHGSGISASAELLKSIGTEPGSAGGRLSISQGENAYVSGYGAVRLERGYLEGSLTQHGPGVDGYVAFSGALVAAGERVFAAQPIQDSFAVVDAGAPDVKVFLENHPVGVTDSGGDLLVTGLRSFEKNRISIDALDLPVDDEVQTVVLDVVPAERSAAIAKFAIERAAPSAEVIFIDANGSLIDAGTAGMLVGGEQDFIVGYDGRAFIRNLKSQNSFVLRPKSGPCEGTFVFEQKANARVTIGPVTCR